MMFGIIDDTDLGKIRRSMLLIGISCFFVYRLELSIDLSSIGFIETNENSTPISPRWILTSLFLANTFLATRFFLNYRAEYGGLNRDLSEKLERAEVLRRSTSEFRQHIETIATQGDELAAARESIANDQSAVLDRLADIKTVLDETAGLSLSASDLAPLVQAEQFHSEHVKEANNQLRDVWGALNDTVAEIRQRVDVTSGTLNKCAEVLASKPFADAAIEEFQKGGKDFEDVQELADYCVESAHRLEAAVGETLEGFPPQFQEIGIPETSKESRPLRDFQRKISSHHERVSETVNGLRASEQSTKRINSLIKTWENSKLEDTIDSAVAAASRVRSNERLVRIDKYGVALAVPLAGLGLSAYAFFCMTF